jgi:hypothetical protein
MPFTSLYLTDFPYLCRPKKKDLFLHISHKAQKVPKILGRQQGVTKNKLYNAKG